MQGLVINFLWMWGITDEQISDIVQVSISYSWIFCEIRRYNHHIPDGKVAVVYNAEADLEI